MKVVLSRLALAAGVVLAATACREPDAPGPGDAPGSASFAPIHRFRLPDAAGSHASIAHEYRAVVAGHASETYRAPRELVRTGRTQRPLPESFAGALRVVVEPSYADRTRSRSTEPFALPVATSAEGRPQLALDLPPALPNGLAIRTLRVTALPPSPEVVLRTDAARVPEGARLELGFGLLAAARGQGPVAFTLEVCEQDACTQALEERVDARSGDRWHDRMLALDAFAGRQVSLRLAARPAEGAGGTFVLPVWSVPVLSAPAPHPPGRRSLILISLDTLRADHLPLYGYARATAPFMTRRFGAEGTVFQHFVASATLTGPAHMSIFTSLPPSVHGHGLGPRHPRADVVTLAEQLRDHGFRTAAFTENAALSSAEGHAKGFERFFEDKGGAGVPKGRIEDTFARGLDWWRRHRDEPTFLFLHTYETHFPYTPPPAALAAVAAEGGPRVPDPVARYDAEIRHVDDQMQALFAALEAEGIRDTVVVVTSDHGEEFGEHGFRGHGVTLHAEVTNVPLLLWGDGIPQGLTIGEVAGHVDLMPTLLELAGVPAPAHLRGRSLVASWRAEPRADVAARPLFSETWLNFGTDASGETVRVGAPAYAVRVADRKLVRYRDRESGATRHAYFDLQRDPRERDDRYDAARPEVAELEALLDTFPEQSERLRAELDPLPGQAPAPSLDPERARKLRALGYLVD